MKLIAWIDQERKGGPARRIYERLAEQTKLHPRYIYHIARGDQRPGQDAAVEIARATDGDVGLFDLLPHLKEAL